MKLRLTDEFEEDFKCPKCKASLIDDACFYGDFEFNEECPKCNYKMEIKMETTVNTFVS